jgi:hypothetical protein
VFAALRDDTEDAARARQEPIMALVWLAGVSCVLATPVAGHLFDDPVFDGILVFVWAFLGGGLFGVAVYWAAGALLHLAARPLGTQGSYRRARHVLAFAVAPLALGLVVYWPIRIAVFGGDLFRSGGSDGGHVWASVFYVFVAWSLTLIVVGVRTVHGWTWPRALAAAGLAAAGAAVLVVPSALL